MTILPQGSWPERDPGGAGQPVSGQARGPALLSATPPGPPSRRALLHGLAGLGAGLLPAVRRAAAQGGPPSAWPREVTDLLGRRVTIPAPPRAVLLGEGFQLLNLILIHPDPPSILAGMGGDLRSVDSMGDAALRRRFPGLAHVPEITAGVGQGFSVERALSLRPDLVVLSAWQNASEETRRNVQVLAAAGVPVIFIDTFINPLANTLPTLRLLGEALGREEAAGAYIRFYEERLARIRARVAAAPPGPGVLMQAFPVRWPCCWVEGPGRSTGELLNLLGARNVARDALPGPGGGQVGMEQVLLMQPEVYIGTGLYRPGERLGIALGTGAPAEEARRSLAEALKAPELAYLPAVRSGRAHGLWNPFNGAAINIVALEAMARWVRPELFLELDPAATLDEINRRFSALPFEGTYWVSADPSRDRPGG